MRTSLLVALFAVILVTGGVLLMRHQAAQTERITRLEAENRDLNAKVGKLTETLNLPASPAAPAKEEGIRMGCEEWLKRHPRVTAPSPEDYALVQAREQLAAAKAAAAAQEQRLQEMEATVEKLNAEISELKSSDQDARDKLASGARLIETMQAELKTKDSRLAQLQTDADKLREESRRNADRLNRVTQVSKELEDINRRRDTYLTNILRRYREMTEIYRTMSMRIDRPSETNPAQPVELSRIQAVISMADEDLRQLQTLNVQAQRLQSRMQ